MTEQFFNMRLRALREEMTKERLDGYLVPMVDEYQSEYVPAFAQRIKFLSGFTGSAGLIVLLQDKAAFFTDSRYTLQAAHEIPPSLFTLFDSSEKLPSAWLVENTKSGMKIGYDPWLHPTEQIERLNKALLVSGATLEPTANNLVDKTWHNQPSPPCEPVVIHEMIYAGMSSNDKRKNLADELKKKKIGSVILTDPSSIAWLLNIRGTDVSHTPLPLSRAIVSQDGHVKWFVDPKKITTDLSHHFGSGVDIKPADTFIDELGLLARSDHTIRVNPNHAPHSIHLLLQKYGANIISGEDPCELPKAIKNAVELEGMRAAHRRDASALIRFFAWLDQTWPHEALTEVSVEHKLASFRESNNLYRGPSFDTIAGVGEHGAIVHYRATPASDRSLVSDTLFLLDSGGQYLDGTTDVTRTIALGQPSAEMRDNFTRVLKGHIALASIKFPDGTTGSDLDVLARQFLWERGLDYGHGTGHGVGCYLGVHEGPQSISKRNKIPLKPGMVLSNEPGYYKTGHYGIRIENLQVVTDILGTMGGDRKYFGFETLTLVPIDRKCIEVALLTDNELEWINAYHLRVRQVLRSMVDESTAIWLDTATLPIKR